MLTFLLTKLPNTFHEALSRGILGYQKFFSECPEKHHISIEVKLFLHQKED